jgi:hypothetical protein
MDQPSGSRPTHHHALVSEEDCPGGVSGDSEMAVASPPFIPCSPIYVPTTPYQPLTPEVEAIVFARKASQETSPPHFLPTAPYTPSSSFYQRTIRPSDTVASGGSRSGPSYRTTEVDDLLKGSLPFTSKRPSSFGKRRAESGHDLDGTGEHDRPPAKNPLSPSTARSSSHKDAQGQPELVYRLSGGNLPSLASGPSQTPSSTRSRPSSRPPRPSPEASSALATAISRISVDVSRLTIKKPRYENTPEGEEDPDGSVSLMESRKARRTAGRGRPNFCPYDQTKRRKFPSASSE